MQGFFYESILYINTILVCKNSVKIDIYNILNFISMKNEECLGFLDQRKRAKMQWVKDPCQSNVDNLNSVRREVSRHFRNKKKE